MFELLKLLLPFMREIFVGESDFSQSIRRNKLLTFFILVNVGWVVMFTYVSEQNIILRNQLNKSEEVVKTAEAKLSNVKTLPPPNKVASKPSKTAPKQSNTKRPTNPTPQQPNTLRHKLDALRNEEET